MHIVERKQPFVTKFGNVLLVPGTNEVTEDELNELMSDDLFVESVERGDNELPDVPTEEVEAAEETSRKRRRG